ncbi:MAG: phosphoglycerate dehydrogenase [Planctomycetota bacterium]|jgi:phosphoglycerate dehydrogenase-like enzyme|nr:phosphoglycerate dehydrogenase [Planctomycetota bacterium]
MIKILVTPRSLKSADHPALQPLRDAGFEIVIPAPGAMPDADTLKAALPGCRGWLAGVEKITADILASATDLAVISRNGVGVDNVDLDAAKARGIHVANTPGANARGVAELALALIFAVARGIPLCDASIKTGGWERRQGVELDGATLGVVGTGQIGKILIRMALGLGMKTVGYDLYPDKAFAPGDFRYVEPAELARVSDVVSVHIPGGDRPFVDAAFLAAMKKNAVLVNTARASAVDGSAVLSALGDGRLFGYGVDAFDAEPPGISPLVTHPRVVCTSHIGGFTAESVMRAAERAARNIVDALKKETA